MFLHTTTARERRSSFRISPPASLVKEMAVWFMPPVLGHLLTTEELGLPQICSLHDTGGVRIENVCGGGICFSLAADDLHNCGDMRCQHSYIYLKLRPALPGKHQPTCLFLGVQLLQASAQDGRVKIRCKIITRGSAASGSKAFQLFHVEKAGVRELVVWCEEINRMGRGILPPVTPGLDLEYLLMELNTQSPPMSTSSPQFACGL